MENIEEIRELLHKNGVQMTEDEFQTTINELQYLVDIWLNQVEKQIFEGKTLDELFMDSNI